MSATDTAAKATALKQLHEAPEILRVVNVWDAITARTIADLPGTRAIATAGHSIAASHGYKDGEIPLETALAAVARIVEAVDLPVSADLDAGFGDAGETVRRAIGIGVVGANVEDRLVPLAEAVAAVEAVVAAGEREGIAFQLNARTDAFVRGGDKPLDAKIEDAITRGRAYLDAGAALVSRQEDTGAVMTPAMMLVMLPYFGVVFFNDNPLVMTILSYVPFSAPVGMPVRLFFGEAQWWEPLISLAVLAAAAAVVVLVASRIYANSLLRMGSRVPLREALRSAG